MSRVMLAVSLALAVAIGAAAGGTAWRVHAGQDGEGSGAVRVASAQTVASASTGGAFVVVDGQGSAAAAPDVAHLMLGVETVGTTAKEATDVNSTAMQAVITAVKAQNVAAKDIQTTNFSINPVYAQPKSNTDQPKITGYRVANTVAVTVQDVSTTSKILDAAVQAGANSSVGVSFGIKDTTALQQQALTAAVQQAQSKADAIAKAAGLKLTGVYSVVEAGATPPTPRVPMAAAAVASAAAPPVEQGQLTVQATVEVSFQYTR